MKDGGIELFHRHLREWGEGVKGVLPVLGGTLRQGVDLRRKGRLPQPGVERCFSKGRIESFQDCAAGKGTTPLALQIRNDPVGALPAALRRESRTPYRATSRRSPSAQAMHSAIAARLPSIFKGNLFSTARRSSLIASILISGASDARKRKGFFAEGMELLTATTTCGVFGEGGLLGLHKERLYREGHAGDCRVVSAGIS